MGPAVAATVYCAAAIVAAWFFRPRMVVLPTLVRALLFWLVSTPILFLIAAPLPSLLAVAGLLAALGPRREERAAFYVMTLAAVPVVYVAAVPFPGLNYLVALDFAKIACIVVLAPALFLSPKPAAARFAPFAGVAILLITILFSAQEFRTANLTSGIRASLDNILLYALPFMALIRLLPDLEDFDRLLGAYILVAVIFFFMALVSQATAWNFYTYLTARFGADAFADFRYGFLRVSVTVAPIFVGYVMTLGLIAVEYFRAERRIGFAMAIMWRAMFVFAAAITFSRGAWLAMAAGVVAYYFFSKAPRSVRPVVLGLALVVGAPLLSVNLMTADLERFDQFGTFEYRRLLLEASWIQIREKPVFGDSRFLESGNFDHLMQGQVVVDIVNYYLQIVLAHGVVGLGLYLAMFASVAIGLLRLGDLIRSEGPTFERRRAAVLASIAAYLIMMSTVSAVSLGAHFGVLNIAVATAFLAAGRKRRRDLRAAPNDAPGARNQVAPAAVPAASRAGDLYG